MKNDDKKDSERKPTESMYEYLKRRAKEMGL